MRYKIDIPKPCHEDWEKMTPTEKGKFCALCQREVFDLTEYSNIEAFQIVANAKNICARVTSSQLNQSFASKFNDKFSIYALIASLGLASLIPQNAITQELYEEPVVEVQKKVEIAGAAFFVPDIYIPITQTIRFKLLDQEGNPIAGAKIRIGKTNLKTTSKQTGDFELKYPKYYEHEVLKIKVEGMPQKKIKIQSLLELKNQSVIEIKKEIKPTKEFKSDSKTRKKSIWQRLLSFFGLSK